MLQKNRTSVQNQRQSLFQPTTIAQGTVPQDTMQHYAQPANAVGINAN